MSFDRVQFRPAVPGEQPEVEVPSEERTVPLRSLNGAPTAAPAPERKMKVKKQGVPMKMAGIVFVLVLVAGIGTGAVLAQFMGGTQAELVGSVDQNKTAQEVESAVKVGAIFGVPDQKTFRDEVEGVLIKGGISGEGSHTLLREGGISQNVYLTSSVVDLDQFENAKVKVWGETFKGQKAGWLMDVGRLEVRELTASKPSWYEEK